MIAPLDQQLIGRYCEVMRGHQGLPVYTAAISESMASQDSIDRAVYGMLTHIMYVKDGKIYVGWVDRNPNLQFFLDAYGT